MQTFPAEQLFAYRKKKKKIICAKCNLTQFQNQYPVIILYIVETIMKTKERKKKIVEQEFYFLIRFDVQT